MRESLTLFREIVRSIVLRVINLELVIKFSYFVSWVVIQSFVDPERESLCRVSHTANTAIRR